MTINYKSRRYISDEESDTKDPQTLIKRSPIWRSEKLSQLLQKLDERHARSREKDNSKFLRVRKVGTSSKRSSPPNAPHWAVEMTGHALHGLVITKLFPAEFSK